MNSRRGGHVIATRYCFAMLMTEFVVFTAMTRKHSPEQSFLIPKAAIDECYCPNGVDKSSFTARLAVVLTITVVSVICCSVVPLPKRTTRSCYSLFTSNILPTVLFVFRLKVRLSADTSCSINIGSGCELYGNILFLMGRIAFTDLSMKEVPMRMEIADFLTISLKILMRASPMCTWVDVVPTTSTF